MNAGRVFVGPVGADPDGPDMDEVGYVEPVRKTVVASVLPPTRDQVGDAVNRYLRSGTRA